MEKLGGNASLPVSESPKGLLQAPGATDHVKNGFVREM
jgi:hypothetical protein